MGQSGKENTGAISGRRACWCSRFLLMVLALQAIERTSPVSAFIHRPRRSLSHLKFEDPGATSFHKVSIFKAVALIRFSSQSEDEVGQDVAGAVSHNNLEKAWRHAKKPLLRIGSKGATMSHGNSLRQLLDAHTVVKVKVNTRQFDGSLEAAFDTLRSLAEANGAEKGIEMIQAREAENLIMFGMPGTLKRIEDGSFPSEPTTAASTSAP